MPGLRSHRIGNWLNPALFVLKLDDTCVAKLLDIAIPQYAFHVDEESGRETPLIVVQAETNGEVSAIGCSSLDGSEFGVGMFDEFRLLGGEKPKSATGI